MSSLMPIASPFHKALSRGRYLATPDGIATVEDSQAPSDSLRT